MATQRYVYLTLLFACVFFVAGATCTQAADIVTTSSTHHQTRRKMLLDVGDACSNVMKHVCGFANATMFEKAMDSYFPSKLVVPLTAGATSSTLTTALFVSLPTCESTRAWLSHLASLQCVYQHDVCHETLREFNLVRMGKVDGLTCPSSCKSECEIAKTEFNKLLNDDIPRPRGNCDTDMYKACGVPSYDLFTSQKLSLANDIINNGLECQYANNFVGVAPLITCVLSLSSCAPHWKQIRGRVNEAVMRIDFDSEMNNVKNMCNSVSMRHCGATCRFALPLMRNVALGGTGIVDSTLLVAEKRGNCTEWNTQNVLILITVVVVFVATVAAINVYCSEHGSCMCGPWRSWGQPPLRGRTFRGYSTDSGKHPSGGGGHYLQRNRHSARDTSMDNFYHRQHRVSAGTMTAGLFGSNTRMYTQTTQQKSAQGTQVQHQQGFQSFQSRMYELSQLHGKARLILGEPPGKAQRVLGEPLAYETRNTRPRINAGTSSTASVSTYSGARSMSLATHGGGASLKGSIESSSRSMRSMSPNQQRRDDSTSSSSRRIRSMLTTSPARSVNYMGNYDSHGGERDEQDFERPSHDRASNRYSLNSESSNDSAGKEPGVKAGEEVDTRRYGVRIKPVRTPEFRSMLGKQQSREGDTSVRSVGGMSESFSRRRFKREALDADGHDSDDTMCTDDIHGGGGGGGGGDSVDVRRVSLTLQRGEGFTNIVYQSGEAVPAEHLSDQGSLAEKESSSSPYASLHGGDDWSFSSASSQPSDENGDDDQKVKEASNVTDDSRPNNVKE
jgi:hypothetical protein